MHDHAAAHDIFHKAVPFQLAQRLSQGRAGNVETIGIIGFHDAFAGGDFSRDDGLLQDFVSDFTNGAALHHWLECQGHGLVLLLVHLGLLLHFVYKLHQKNNFVNKLQRKEEKQYNRML